MERLLVTGASGFLGSRIVSAYREKYHIFAPSHRELDITDRRNVRAVFERIRPQYVIHCAAVSDVGQCEREPERSWKINVDGSRNLAEQSACFLAKCLVCSSDQVYFGSNKKGPHREDETLCPGNVYGREKLKAEEECLRINPECVLLRLSWMYDVLTERENQHGDFFRTLAERLESREVLEYPVNDVRGITDVNEVLGNLERAFTLEGGIYNFGSPNDRNTYESVRELFSALEWDSGRLLKNQESFAAEPRNLSMDTGRAEENGILFSSTVQALIRNGRFIFGK